MIDVRCPMCGEVYHADPIQKTGLLMKMWKFIVAIFAPAWKLIAAAFVAILAWLKRMFRRLTGRKEQQEQESSTETVATAAEEAETSVVLSESRSDQESGQTR